MIIYEGPVKLMLCFVSEVVMFAKSVGQDPNIINGGQSVSSPTWLNFSRIKQLSGWIRDVSIWQQQRWWWWLFVKVSSPSVIWRLIIVIFRGRDWRHSVLHQTETLPDWLCDVWAGLLLCQDLPAAPNIRPVRPVRGPGEEGRLHHHLQGLLRPGHVDGPTWPGLSVQTSNLSFTSRTSVSSPRRGWSIVGAPLKISVISQISSHHITTSLDQF